MSSYNKKNLAVSLEQTFSSAMYLLEITAPLPFSRLTTGLLNFSLFSSVALDSEHVWGGPASKRNPGEVSASPSGKDREDLCRPEREM